MSDIRFDITVSAEQHARNVLWECGVDDAQDLLHRGGDE